MKQVLGIIAQADDVQIREIMRAVEQWFSVQFPDWDVVYMAVHKEPTQREADLQTILHMLQKEKTDSLG